MGMTMAEKILASRSGRDEVRPGEYVWARVDGTGVFGPIPMMEELGIEQVFDNTRVYAVDDHFAPSPTVERANAHKALKEFATKYDIENYFEYGRHGILHQVFPENGYVSPGDLIVSIDSHSTSYGCFNAMGAPIMEGAVTGRHYGTALDARPAQHQVLARRNAAGILRGQGCDSEDRC